MWFIAHTGTPGCEHVVSIDFEKCLVTMPEQDDVIESEFELLCMPLAADVPIITKVMCHAIQTPLKSIEWLPVVAFPSTPQEPLVEAPRAPPPSPVMAAAPNPPAPPPSPLSIRSVSPTEPKSSLSTPTAKRKQHTLLTDGIICKWVDVHGPTWRDLARSMGGREEGWSDDVVRNRYIRIIEELRGVPYERRRRTKEFKKPETQVEKWTEPEDALLEMLILDLPKCRGGVPWKTIAKRFGGSRTQQAIRNRANRLGLREETQYAMNSPSSSGE